jgi:hypothetical protein
MSFLSGIVGGIGGIAKIIGTVANAVSGVADSVNPAEDFRGKEGEISEVNDLTRRLANKLNLDFEPSTPTTNKEYYRWSQDVKYVLDQFQEYQTEVLMPIITKAALSATTFETSQEKHLTEDELVDFNNKTIDSSVMTATEKEEAKVVLSEMNDLQVSTGTTAVKIHSDYTNLVDSENFSENAYMIGLVDTMVSSGLRAIYKVGPGRWITPGGTAFIPAPSDWHVSRENQLFSSELDYTGGNFAYTDPADAVAAFTVSGGALNAAIDSGTGPTSYGNVDGLDEVEMVNDIVTNDKFLFKLKFLTNRSVGDEPLDDPYPITGEVLSSQLKGQLYKWHLIMNQSATMDREMILWVVVYVKDPVYAGDMVVYSAPMKIRDADLFCSSSLRVPLTRGTLSDDTNEIEFHVAVAPLLSGATADLTSDPGSISFEINEFYGEYDNSVPVAPSAVTYYDQYGTLRELNDGTSRFITYFGKLDYSKVDDPNASIRGIYSQILGNDGKELGDAIIRLRVWALSSGVDLEASYAALGLTQGLTSLQTPGNWLRNDGPFSDVPSSSVPTIIKKLVRDLTIMRKFMGIESTGVEVIKEVFNIV